MKKQILILVFLMALLSGKELQAQQLPLFSQYLFNGFLINPAYAGLDGYSAVNLTAREQWLGLPNSPKTHLVSYQTRVLKNNFVRRSGSARRKMLNRYTSGRVGLGGYIYNDQSGLINRTGGQFTYAYHMPMGEGTLSMALSASLSQFAIDRSKIKTEIDDSYINNNALNMFIPDMGFGAVYSTPTYYAGLSVDQLLQAYLKFGKDVDKNYKLYRHYYITGGYRYEFGESAIEPNMLLKVTNQFNYQLDIGAKYYINDQYWAGLSFRTGSAFILMAGVTVDKYHFGYAFDYNLTSIQKHSFGSHEIMVAYKFGDNASRMRWLHR
ncbi:MAG: type IX secretion system membrane protein PorP/SprF [Bacteroidota bacterium]|nr:type IX secretion system membrane protein PorP/SprF [Bacteroidota bacterium]